MRGHWRSGPVCQLETVQSYHDACQTHPVTVCIGRSRHNASCRRLVHERPETPGSWLWSPFLCVSLGRGQEEQAGPTRPQGWDRSSETRPLLLAPRFCPCKRHPVTSQPRGALEHLTKARSTAPAAPCGKQGAGGEGRGSTHGFRGWVYL